MLNHFRQRGHCPNLDAIGSGANSFQLRYPAQVDYNLWFLDAVLEPIEAVHASSQNPAIASLLLEQLLRISNRAWLQQFKCWHNIANYGHRLSFRITAKCAPSRDAAWAVPIRVKSGWCRR